MSGTAGVARAPRGARAAPRKTPDEHLQKEQPVGDAEERGEESRALEAVEVLWPERMRWHHLLKVEPLVPPLAVEREVRAFVAHELQCGDHTCTEYSFLLGPSTVQFTDSMNAPS